MKIVRRIINWLKGLFRPNRDEFGRFRKNRPDRKKGLTYEEYYGDEKAKVVKERLSTSHTGYKYPLGRHGLVTRFKDPTKRKSVTCMRCGKTFSVLIKRRPNAQYCSNACRWNR